MVKFWQIWRIFQISELIRWFQGHSAQVGKVYQSQLSFKLDCSVSWLFFLHTLAVFDHFVPQQVNLTSEMFSLSEFHPHVLAVHCWFIFCWWKYQVKWWREHDLWMSAKVTIYSLDFSFSVEVVHTCSAELVLWTPSFTSSCFGQDKSWRAEELILCLTSGARRPCGHWPWGDLTIGSHCPQIAMLLNVTESMSHVIHMLLCRTWHAATGYEAIWPAVHIVRYWGHWTMSRCHISHVIYTKCWIVTDHICHKLNCHTLNCDSE